MNAVLLVLDYFGLVVVGMDGKNSGSIGFLALYHGFRFRGCLLTRLQKISTFLTLVKTPIKPLIILLLLFYSTTRFYSTLFLVHSNTVCPKALSLLRVLKTAIKLK